MPVIGNHSGAAAQHQSGAEQKGGTHGYGLFLESAWESAWADELLIASYVLEYSFPATQPRLGGVLPAEVEESASRDLRLAWMVLASNKAKTGSLCGAVGHVVPWTTPRRRWRS